MRLEFNIAGPCFPDEHYMIPPERRLGEVMELIEGHKFFTFTGGRQTGKTTSLFWLQNHYNQKSDWRGLWVDIQTAREQPDPAKAFRTVLQQLDRVCRHHHPSVQRPDIESLLRDPQMAVRDYLSHIAGHDERQWVVFFDEADGLVGETMVSFLTQLREGYIGRRQDSFPASIVLVGLRQVRDYVLRHEDRLALSWLGTTSPFNVTAENRTTSPFTAAEVVELLQQHTEKTGQVFLPEAAAKIYELGQGHPWLTNALADQIVRRDVRDRQVAITVEHVESAKETIILERRTHIDSLVAKLREDRVRRIIDPMIAGEQPDGDMLDDDLAYVVGLGLVRRVGGMVQIANPIYREVIPRAMTYARQVSIANDPAGYVLPNGSLDMLKLMKHWQKFWRIDGHLAADGFGYRESGPHLMLMAFLQRVINGGGKIHREYGLGRGALDLLIEWKIEKHAIEVKLRRDTETEEDALEQVAGYLDHLGLEHGWLVLFDLRSTLSWKERTYQRDVEFLGKRITIVGG
jgi:hypothetical protein